MKHTVEYILSQALASLKAHTQVPEALAVEVRAERARDPGHGDFASNLAMVLAKPCGQSPRHMAQLLVDAIGSHPDVERIEIAGPGFINFYLRSQTLSKIVGQVLQAGETFGHSEIGRKQKVLLEYVSSNPTGPLHVGHGRGAAFGATLSSLLKVAGYEVSREYYVNDAGRQMNILAVSLWLRYLAAAGQEVVFPANAYQGDYVQTIARDFLEKQGPGFVHPWSEISEGLPADEPLGGDREIYIDALIDRARQLLGQEGFARFHKKALDSVLKDIQEDLAEFGVDFDCWFSEQSLSDDGSIEKAIQALESTGHTYRKEGALWFRARDFGDEKDRVLIRANGHPTYFASDIAYHWNKYNRGFDRVIDIFGADHHGYVTRVKAAVNALGHDETALRVLFVQFAILYREASGYRCQLVAVLSLPCVSCVRKWARMLPGSFM